MRAVAPRGWGAPPPRGPHGWVSFASPSKPKVDPFSAGVDSVGHDDPRQLAEFGRGGFDSELTMDQEQGVFRRYDGSGLLAEGYADGTIVLLGGHDR